MAAYFIATAGCNFHCRWRQNWEMSQMPLLHHAETEQEVLPEQIVAAAGQAGCKSIVYTYPDTLAPGLSPCCAT